VFRYAPHRQVRNTLAVQGRAVNTSDETPTHRLLRELYKVREPVAIEPANESPTDIERKSFKREESVRTLDSHAHILVEAGRDNLLALDDLVAEGAYAISPWVLARASLEASALAVWLLDRSLDVTTRIGRSLALRYETLRAQQILAQDASDDEKVREISARIDKVESVANEIGLTRVENKNGERIGIAERVPKKVILARQLLGSESLYRILSGVAHADVNTVMQLTFATVSGPTPGGIVKAPTPPTKILKKLVAYVTAAYSRAAWEMILRTGADAAEAAVALEKAFTDLEHKDDDDTRFWRITPKVDS